MNEKSTQDSHLLIEALRALLLNREANTQEQICAALEKEGFEVNQSKVSRLLRKVGAIKVENAKGQTVYSLPREPAPPSLNTPMHSLVLGVDCNESMIVILTSPGCASMVARVLEYAHFISEILGTVAGDDTIFVAPRSTKLTQKLADEIKRFVGI
ncbi:MAG: arginine repressor [Parachlamydiales bacterium]|jgi:transcriptional regulator of arginine metabolism